MPRAQSRKRRGYDTQRKLAERWRENGMAPYAKPVGAGEGGEDIIDPPFGLVIEVKARDTVSLVAAIKQASKSAPDSIPVCVWRHNGQGPSNMDEWTVTLRLTDFESLYRAWRMLNVGPRDV